MNWLITGGCGFIGVQLIKELLKCSENNIRIIDNLSVGSLEDLRGELGNFALEFGNYSWTSPVSFVEGDIQDGKLVRKCVQGADKVIHLAAKTGVAPSIKDPISDFAANALGTFTLLNASAHAKVKRFIFASSGAPLGNVIPPIHEDLPARPLSPYGASKLSGEAYCSAFFHSFGLEAVALRFGNVYGIGSLKKTSVVAKFIREALNPKQFVWEIYGDGTQTRDFVYVEDLISAIIKSSEVPGIGGEVFQIATSRETTVAEIAELLNKVLASHGLDKMSIENSQFRVGDSRRNFSDTSKAKRLLGWESQTDLLLGLQKTFEYFLRKKGDL